MDNVETAGSGETFALALDAFEAAWVDPRHTAIQLPPVDVNKVLAERYTVEPAVHMTRQQLWDMEVRNAWDPLRGRTGERTGVRGDDVGPDLRNRGVCGALGIPCTDHSTRARTLPGHPGGRRHRGSRARAGPWRSR